MINCKMNAFFNIPQWAKRRKEYRKNRMFSALIDNTFLTFFYLKATMLSPSEILVCRENSTETKGSQKYLIVVKPSSADFLIHFYWLYWYSSNVILKVNKKREKKFSDICTDRHRYRRTNIHSKFHFSAQYSGYLFGHTAVMPHAQNA